MKTCRHCGHEAPDDEYICVICDRPLPFKRPSEVLVRKVALTVVIPVFIWVVMTRLLGI